MQGYLTIVDLPSRLTDIGSNNAYLNHQCESLQNARNCANTQLEILQAINNRKIDFLKRPEYSDENY